MKKNIIVSLIALALPAAMLAGDDDKKTTTVLNVTTSSTVVISESTEGLTLDVKADDGSMTETIRVADYSEPKTISTEQFSAGYNEFLIGNGGIGMRSSKHWDVISSGLLIGLVDPMGQPAGYGLKWSKSFEVGWLNALGVRYRNRSMSVSLGLGFDWRNYKMTGDGGRMVLDPATGIAKAPYPEGATDCASRIKVFSLGFPLLYTQKIPGTTLAITAGAILDINTHASLLTTYRNTRGDRMEEYSEGIGRRKVSYDLFGSISFFHGCGLYIRYSPQSVLSGAAAPEFHPLSVGVSLFL